MILDLSLARIKPQYNLVDGNGLRDKTLLGIFPGYIKIGIHRRYGIAEFFMNLSQFDVDA
ncbi:MAG: hypothetical protein R8K46_01745 [Mariprofundaceae bacterium]